MVTFTPAQHLAKRRKKSDLNLTQYSSVPQIRLPKCQCPGRPFLNRCPTCGRQTALVVSEPEDEESHSDAESMISQLGDIMSYPATQSEAEQQSFLRKTSNDEGKPQMPEAFPFERLPQELKDVVYGHCTIEHLSLPTKPIPPTLLALGRAKLPIHSHLRHVPFPGLLGVNRKIGHDYRMIVQHLTTVVFNDHNQFRWQPLDLSEARGGQLREVRHAEFNFDGMCRASPTGCRIAIDLAYSLGWIKRTVTQFPGLQTVTIRLGLWWSANLANDYSWPDSPHDNAILDVLEDFTAVEHLVKIEAYRKPGADIDMHLTDGEIEAAMWVLWEKGRGFIPPPSAPGVYCSGEYKVQCRGVGCGLPH